MSGIKRHGLMGPAQAYPWTVVVAWLVAMSLSVGVIVAWGDQAFSTHVQRYDNSGSSRAETLLRERFAQRPDSNRPNEVLVLRSASLRVDDAAFREQAQALVQRLSALDGDVLHWTLSYFQTGNEALVSKDRHSTVVPMQLRDPERSIGAVQQVLAQRDGPSDLVWYLVGRASVGTEFKALAQNDLKAELRIGLPVALLVLLVVFATAVAALVPLLVALAAIVVTLAIMVLAGPLLQAYFLVTNMVVMMGLALPRRACCCADTPGGADGKQPLSRPCHRLQRGHGGAGPARPADHSDQCLPQPGGRRDPGRIAVPAGVVHVVAGAGDLAGRADRRAASALAAACLGWPLVGLVDWLVDTPPCELPAAVNRPVACPVGSGAGYENRLLRH
jgi:uncharacterized membrane protein